MATYQHRISSSDSAHYVKCEIRLPLQIIFPPSLGRYASRHELCGPCVTQGGCRIGAKQFLWQQRMSDAAVNSEVASPGMMPEKAVSSLLFSRSTLLLPLSWLLDSLWAMSLSKHYKEGG